VMMSSLGVQVQLCVQLGAGAGLHAGGGIWITPLTPSS